MCADCWSALRTLSLGVPGEPASLKRFPHPKNTAAWLAGKETLAAGEIKYTSPFQLYACNVVLLAPLFFERTCAISPFLFSINGEGNPRTDIRYMDLIIQIFVQEIPRCLANGWRADGAIQRIQQDWLCRDFGWTLRIGWAEAEMALTPAVLGYDCET